MSDTDRDEIRATTRCCAVYGHPIQHSASPAMQNAGIAALGLDWRYLAYDVHPDNLGTAIEGAKAMRFIGLNLTVPHKLLALPMLEELDETARAWGAVNTVLFEGQAKDHCWKPLVECDTEDVQAVRSRGFNTDADAIIRSVEEDLGIRLKGMTVLLLGAGGAGRTAALRLASAAVKRLFLVNRTASKAEEIAREITQKYPGVESQVGYPGDDVDLLLNATSLGLKLGDPVPFDTNRFSLKQAKAVYDMIYQPAETKLLQAAKRAGCRTSNGLGMLLYQGATALEIWSGRKAPLETMRDALIKKVYGP